MWRRAWWSTRYPDMAMAQRSCETWRVALAEAMLAGRSSPEGRGDEKRRREFFYVISDVVQDSAQCSGLVHTHTYYREKDKMRTIKYPRIIFKEEMYLQRSGHGPQGIERRHWISSPRLLHSQPARCHILACQQQLLRPQLKHLLMLPVQKIRKRP